MKFRTLLTMAAASMMSLSALADAPAGYYDSCEGKCGAALLSALQGVIGDHTIVSYDGLWKMYKDSDTYPEDGKIWDMYSTKHWNYEKEQCGNYSAVGVCYNREHSFPKSWFNKKSPMVSDGFHIFPTDGYVNSQRGSDPYGECANGTSKPSSNGIKALGKSGKCTSPGYSGNVFEPDDMYKGDLARSHFYMAACYNSQISSWSSPALAGNSYPAFKSWQVDVLVKWHNQDPVSRKETDRNDAVYQYQHNRNPFVDHPDLVDHIWGDRKNEPWYAASATKPQLTLPVNNSSLDMGICAVNNKRTATVTVQGKNITGQAKVSVSGNGFSVSPSTLSASQVNAGTEVTVTFSTATAGKHSGVLTVTCGDTKSVVNISTEAVDGLPVGRATHISESSFDANWVNIDGPSAKYTLDVRHDGASIAGYPVSVNAAAETYTVEDLEPLTTYTYTVSSATLTSREVSVTTGAPQPSIQLLFDGTLYFICEPGEVSEIAEMLIEAENIVEDIRVNVTEPFEISTDKANWSTSLTLAPDEERFYLRMNAKTSGAYYTVISLQSDDYVNDEYMIGGMMGSLEPTFVEDFEADFDLGSSYYTAQWRGTACLWDLVNIGMYSGGHDSKQAIRFYNKSGNSSIAMAEDKPTGIGTVTFWAKGWEPKEGVSLSVEVSTDQGATWRKAAQIDADGSQDYQEYTVTVNEPKPARIRFTRTSQTGRIRLDDIAISDCMASEIVPDADYHKWDAYCRDGQLYIESSEDNVDALVYGIDGIIRYDAPVAGGVNIIDSLTAGTYVVAIGDFTRVVVIK